MNNLFNKMFGKDALSYEFDKGLKRVVISPDCLPIYQYDHALWEQLFPTVLTSFTSLLEQQQSPQSIPASSPASSNTDPVSSSSTSLSSSPATSPSNSSCSPLSSVTVDTKLPLFLNHQNLCLFIIYEFVLQINDIELVVDPGHLNNPLQSPVRPSESAITKGYRLMDACPTGETTDDEDFDAAVKFGDLGVFDSRALDIWMKASKDSSIKFRVQEEENWMKTTSTTLTPHQINEIRALLFDSEPQEEILRIGDVMVDAEDLSTLAAERYISGFLIDAACLRYSEEPLRKNFHSLYLPAVIQTWALTRNVQFL